MSKYRKIDPKIWNDIKFRGLSDRGKLAFIFGLTHPHMTALGAMRATIPGLAAEIGWSAKAFREAFGEALARAMVRHDEGASLVWYPKFLEYNKPESPNTVKAWGAALDYLPECELKWLIIKYVKAYAEGLTEAFGEALPEAFAKTTGIHEHEHEHELELEQDKNNTAREKLKRVDLDAGIPFAEIIGHLNQLTGKNYRPDAETNREWIRARFKTDGATLQDFIHINTVKTEEWLGTKWEYCLRPETLYCKKHWESYRNQRVVPGAQLSDRARKNKAASISFLKKCGVLDAEPGQGQVDFDT